LLFVGAPPCSREVFSIPPAQYNSIADVGKMNVGMAIGGNHFPFHWLVALDSLVRTRHGKAVMSLRTTMA
jgi:hypothetical protein